jgi:hypothetical protein
MASTASLSREDAAQWVETAAQCGGICGVILGRPEGNPVITKLHGFRQMSMNDTDSDAKTVCVRAFEDEDILGALGTIFLHIFYPAIGHATLAAYKVTHTTYLGAVRPDPFVRDPFAPELLFSIDTAGTHYTPPYPQKTQSIAQDEWDQIITLHACLRTQHDPAIASRMTSIFKHIAPELQRQCSTGGHNVRVHFKRVFYKRFHTQTGLEDPDSVSEATSRSVTPHFLVDERTCGAESTVSSSTPISSRPFGGFISLSKERRPSQEIIYTNRKPTPTRSLSYESTPQKVTMQRQATPNVVWQRKPLPVAARSGWGVRAPSKPRKHTPHDDDTGNEATMSSLGSFGNSPPTQKISRSDSIDSKSPSSKDVGSDAEKSLKEYTPARYMEGVLQWGVGVQSAMQNMSKIE